MLVSIQSEVGFSLSPMALIPLGSITNPCSFKLLMAISGAETERLQPGRSRRRMCRARCTKTASS